MEQRDKGTTLLKDIRTVTAIEFCVQSNKSIIDYSAIQEQAGLIKPEIYTGENPTVGGVIDNRLGTTSRTIRCSTCMETGWNCPGHFGHVQLAEPVYHIGMIPYVRNILRCVCIVCKKLLVGNNNPDVARIIQTKQGAQRYEAMKNLCSNINHCQNCGSFAHKITVDKKFGHISVIATPIRKNVADEEMDKNKKRAPQGLTPQIVYDILKNLSDEDVMTLGINPVRTRPENMIIVNLPVPPIQVRPSMRLESSNISNMHDDLTGKLVEIIRSNQNLKDTKGNGSLSKYSNVNEDHLCLQLHVATWQNNDNLGTLKSQQKSGKPTKSLAERLEGKEGRIRANLMGKRADYSGRGVIGSDPYIDLDEVGVPLRIARNLTYREIVTPNNIGFLTRLVQNGTRVYPGATHVIQSRVEDDGSVREVFCNLQVRRVTDQIVLQIGDKVERQIVNGDVALLNRQPSLHKYSIMTHRIHVLRDPTNQTIRINVNITDPYNADFDGDEMNLHLPQSIQTVVEIRLNAGSTNLFVSAGNSKILNKPKQDSSIGSYILTDDDVYIDWKDVMDILAYTKGGNAADIPKGHLVSGKHVYSLILPKELNLEQKRDDAYNIFIRNGELLAGRISSSENGSVVQKLWFQYGSKVTSDFIDDVHRMMLQFLMLHGVTVGAWDAQVPKKVHREIRRMIETRRREMMTKITEYENDPYAASPEAFEAHMQESLQSLTGDFNKIVMANLDKKSGLYLAIKAGSSGTDMNATQIVVAVGQVIIDQKRIMPRFNNRSLPCYAQFDNSPAARGMCVRSFMQGLSPQELFYQAMAGREGVINTAITTADTGYFQRKLIKFLEDIKQEYDGTVRNANDKIIQLVYGDAGLNNERIVEQRIHMLKQNNKQLLNSCTYTEKELTKIRKIHPDTKYDSKTNDKLGRKLIKMRDQLRQIAVAIGVNSAVLQEDYRMPVDLNQYIINIVNRPERSDDIVVDPYYVLQNIREMYSGDIGRIVKFVPSSSVIKKRDDQNIKFLIKTYLYNTLTPRKCTEIHHLRKDEFDELVKYYYRTISTAKSEGGEMVGVLGGQSIGEQTTQTNLKSFQKSGTGRTVAGGLTRIKELASFSKKIKTPLMDIPLLPEYREDKNIARKIASSLKYTVIEDVLHDISVVYDPTPNKKNSLMNRDGATNIFKAAQGKGGCQGEIEGLPWVVRMVLSKEKMIERSTTMLDIKMSFCNNWAMRDEDGKGNKKEYKKVIEKIIQCAITSNFDNSDVPIIHIRFNARNYNMRTFILFQKMIHKTYRVKGIPKIHESKSISEEKYVHFTDEGDVEMRKQLIISTEGINLPEMTKINGIDINRTRCNDVLAVYEMYGVEAARATFIREFNMALASSGTSANHQHISQLADAITHMGGLIPVNRNGSNKLDTDPLSRASFEQTVLQLTAAGIFSQTDHLRTVSSRIMLGRMINGGTGAYDLLMDHEKIETILERSKSTITKPSRRRTRVSELKRK
jgi:DNA-directed RNA polymerase II subunit RPB1